MGTVIKFPRVRRGRHERPPGADGAAAGDSAAIIILPVVRIERMLDTPDVKANAAKSVAKPLNQSLTRSPQARKRRKRPAPELTTQVCG